VAFGATGAGFTTQGAPLARDTALVEIGVDWRFSDNGKVGLSYNGSLSGSEQQHAITGGVSWKF